MTWACSRTRRSRGLFSKAQWHRCGRTGPFPWVFDVGGRVLGSGDRSAVQHCLTSSSTRRHVGRLGQAELRRTSTRRLLTITSAATLMTAATAKSPVERGEVRCRSSAAAIRHRARGPGGFCADRTGAMCCEGESEGSMPPRARTSERSSPETDDRSGGRRTNRPCTFCCGSRFRPARRTRHKRHQARSSPLRDWSPHVVVRARLMAFGFDDHAAIAVPTVGSIRQGQKQPLLLFRVFVLRLGLFQ